MTKLKIFSNIQRKREKQEDTVARRKRRPLDPVAEEAYRRQLFREIWQRAEEREELAQKTRKPPKAVPESMPADILFFVPLAIISAVGMVMMTIVTINERPGALVPLWFFFGVPMYIALGLMAHQIFTKPQPPMHPVPVRYFTAYGMFVATIVSAITLIRAAIKLFLE